MANKVFVLRLSLLASLLLIGVLLWRTHQVDNLTGSNEVSDREIPAETICDVALREEQKNDFEIYTGQIAPVDFNTNPDARLFRTTIAAQVAEGPNFAGHYTVASWGCGTECQGYAIVDVVNGKIIEYVPYHEFQVDYGISPSVDSNILVFNPRFSREFSTGKTAEELFHEDFNAVKARIYYALVESGDDAYIRTLCTENLYSGLIDKNAANSNIIDSDLVETALKKSPTMATNHPLKTLIQLTDGEMVIDIIIGQNEIWIQPFEVALPNHPFSKSLTISIKDYPHLFSQGVANESFISAQLIHENNKRYIKITNNQPDHGGFSETTSVYVDMDTKAISIGTEPSLPN